MRASQADDALAQAVDVATAAQLCDRQRPIVTPFFEASTCSISYVVRDPGSRTCAIIDPVLDYDAASARRSSASADAIIAFVEEQQLSVRWLLETHVHADHLSAGRYLQSRLGGEIAIGRAITDVQATFGALFNEGPSFARDGSQFDRLLDDGDHLTIGDLSVVVLKVPGHTPADCAYVIGEAAFVGDTIFMPDCGTARADFPGGDARQLYRSIRRLLSLPAATRLFVCHDYKAPGRDHYCWETTVAAQRSGNIHIHDGISAEAFVAMRLARDKTLGMPRLILPAIQLNMRNGDPPEPEPNGIRYLKLPLDTF